MSLTIYIHSTIKMLTQNNLTYCYLNKTMTIFTSSEAQTFLDGQRTMRDIEQILTIQKKEREKKLKENHERLAAHTHLY